MFMYKLTRSGSVIRHDGASIPADPANTDYAVFLAWQVAGGVPAPVELPDARQVIFEKITVLERLETPRRLAEAVLGDSGKVWLADNRAAIAALRSEL